MNRPDADTTAIERLLTRSMAAAVVTSALVLGFGLALWVAGRTAEDLLHAGLLVLMATPMIRVAATLAEAVRLRDDFFAASTLLVALLLGATLLLSVAHAAS